MSTWWSAARPMNRENGIFEYTSQPTQICEPAGVDSTKALVCKSLNNLQVDPSGKTEVSGYNEENISRIVKAWLLAV